MSTYSFIDIAATIVGPGGSFALGYGSCNAEEGISVTMLENKSTMTIGADGCVMHSLHAGNGGTVTIRFLKTSGTNKLLQQMYDFQRVSSAFWGLNTIVISDPARGDQIACTQCAFQRFTTINYQPAGNASAFTAIIGFSASRR